MAIPQDRNLRWSLNFVMDMLVSGRRFRKGLTDRQVHDELHQSDEL